MLDLGQDPRFTERINDNEIKIILSSIFLNGATRPLICLFSTSQTKIVRKKVGFSGIRTRITRVAGLHADHQMTTTALFSSTVAINYNIFSVIRVLRYLLSTQTISTDKKTNKMAKLKIFKNLNCILRILTIFFAESSSSASSLSLQK